MGKKQWEVVTCKECGNTEELHFGPFNKHLKERKLCFSCDHWLSFVERDKVDPNCLVIDGNHYIVGNEAEGGRRDSGFSGQKFIIEKFIGERIVTTNLWHQGRIPEGFRGRMPDNARFSRAP